MSYLGDVWVNWFENCEWGYDVCEFQEWRKDDCIEILDQVPILKIDAALYDYIENSMSPIPEELLEEIRNKTYIRKKNMRSPIEYCFIMTSGEEMMIVDTLGTHYPTKKSRLIPRHTIAVFDRIKDDETIAFKFDEMERIMSESLPGCYMKGLTRVERELKKLLFKAIDIKLTNNEDIHKLRYYYSELDPYGLESVHNLSYNDLLQTLRGELLYGWDQKHEAFLKVIIKGIKWLEDTYKSEDEYRKRKIVEG